MYRILASITHAMLGPRGGGSRKGPKKKAMIHPTPFIPWHPAFIKKIDSAHA